MVLNKKDKVGGGQEKAAGGGGEQQTEGGARESRQEEADGGEECGVVPQDEGGQGDVLDAQVCKNNKKWDKNGISKRSSQEQQGAVNKVRGRRLGLQTSCDYFSDKELFVKSVHSQMIAFNITEF